jgi:cell shape-determining protein MreC
MKVTGIPRQAPVAEGQLVFTAGFSQPLSLPSPYPRGIPIGVVTGVGAEEADVQQTVQVTPFVDPEELAYVVVLAPRTERAERRAAG